MVDSRGVYRVLVGKPERNIYLEDPVIDGRIILKLIFKKWDGDMDWIGLLYVFFWVIPRRLNFLCRLFGTHCLFDLHRQAVVE